VRKPDSNGRSRLAVEASVLLIVGQLVRLVGMVDRRQQGCAVTLERQSPPPQVPDSPHRGGIHVGVGEHPPAAQHPS
jgi:hypothetical protein